MISITAIVNELKQERDRIDSAILALEGLNRNSRRGKPFGTGMKTRKRRTMSAAGRARISAAQKARWAKQKKAAKTA
jgi:hypothetical protein